MAPLFQDKKLNEHLANMIDDSHLMPQVRKKVVVLAMGWEQEFGSDPLYKDLARISRIARRFYVHPSYRVQCEGSTGLVRAQDIDSAYRIPKIDVARAGPVLDALILDASTNTSALKSELLVVGLHSPRVESLVEKCRHVQKDVFRYLQSITEGDYLGLLIHANDQLVEVLNQFEEEAAQARRQAAGNSFISTAETVYESEANKYQQII